MAVNFTKADPAAKGYFAPTRFEADVFDCEIEGHIPADLDGAFYRVGPDWFYPPQPHDAGPFNGDGYVGMFRFNNGSVDYRGRFIRTQRYLADRKARRQLFGVYRNSSTDDPSVQALNRTVANTSMYSHAGKLFALKEDAQPFEIDPNTLATRDMWDFYGKYASKTFTAHPKTDRTSGDMICYGYEATGDGSKDIFMYTVDRTGHVTHEIRFQAPVVSMMHDIAVTTRHVILNTTGFVSNPERLRAGKVHWAWDSTVPTYVAIVPRDGTAQDVRWFKGPERAAIHFLNGVTRGNRVIVEAPVSDGNPFPFFPQADASEWNPHKARASIRRWTFDLGSGKDGWEEEVLFRENGQLGRIDDRYVTQPYRYAFMSYNDPARPFNGTLSGSMRGSVSNCIGRFDIATNEVKSYFVGDGYGLQESQFVPRKRDAAEADGYIVAIAANYAERHSELVVVDSVSMEEISRVKLPFRLNSQVHGWWADSTELPLVVPA